MGASLTYFYNLVEPGTFMYHCHVEATEHMQMGMLGNLYVRPIQNRLPMGRSWEPTCTRNPDYNAVLGLDDPLDGDKYAYNDGDGSTRYDVEAALQLGGFDAQYHIDHINVQPLAVCGDARHLPDDQRPRLPRHRQPERPAGSG